MRIHKYVAAALFGALAVLGFSAPVALASNATSLAVTHHTAIAPALGSGPFYIIPTVSNSGDPLTNHGVGNQASLTTSGTKWCPVAATQGYKLHQCSDMSHVLEKDGNGLYTQDLMAGNDQQEFFAANGNGRWTFQSVHTANTYIGVFNPDTGPAWVETQMTGFDTGWQVSATATTTAASATAAKLAHSITASYAITQVNQTTFIKPLSKTLSKAPLIGAYKICTRSGTSRCMTGEGVGEQFQMFQSNYSTFNRSSDQFGYTYTTPNDLCVHGTTSNTVIGSNTACGFSNSASQWDPDSSSPPRLVNTAYGGYLGVLFNNQDGARTTLQPGTGAFYLSQYGS